MTRTKSNSKKAQIWVETVIYTLIGLALIGTMLAFITPQIQKQRDKATIDKTIEAMQQIDNNIIDVQRTGVSNVRQVNFIMNNGNLVIDGKNEKIIFIINGISYLYSEEGKDVKVPNTDVKLITIKRRNKYNVNITLDYSDKLDLKYNGNDNTKILTQSPTPYLISVENTGLSAAGKTTIDISA